VFSLFVSVVIVVVAAAAVAVVLMMLFVCQIRIRCAHVLPTHIFCLKHITQTQTIRGVAITSDSVDSSTDYSQVQAVLDEDNILATNFLDQLVADTPKHDNSESEPPDLVLYYEEANTGEDEDSEDFIFETVYSKSINQQSIRGVVPITSDSVKDADSAFPPVEDIVDTNYLHELVESANSDSPLIKGVQDYHREVNIDVEFPYGTSLSIDIESKYSSRRGTKNNICAVVSGSDGKPMIKNSIDGGNDSHEGINGCEYIRCAFHAMFLGNSDGCGCELEIGFDWLHYHLSVRGCDCFRITEFEPKGAKPDEGLVWPCLDTGCRYAPQMKIHVAPNSVSVNSSGDSKVDEAVHDVVLAATNNFDFKDQLVDAALKSSKSESELALYDEEVRSEDEDDSDVRVEDELLEFDEYSNDSSHIMSMLSDDPINIDVQFPPGTSLSIEYKHTFGDISQICEVQSDGDNIIIRNAAPDGVDVCSYIRCIFHVVFPGHSDGCSCDLQTEYDHYWHLHVVGCDCFQVVDIVSSIPGKPVPKDRNVWPCQGYTCYGMEVYPPQMKVITAAK
jgi:hypothetical protein